MPPGVCVRQPGDISSPIFAGLRNGGRRTRTGSCGLGRTLRVSTACSAPVCFNPPTGKPSADICRRSCANLTVGISRARGGSRFRSTDPLRRFVCFSEAGKFGRSPNVVASAAFVTIGLPAAPQDLSRQVLTSPSRSSPPRSGTASRPAPRSPGRRHPAPRPWAAPSRGRVPGGARR